MTSPTLILGVLIFLFLMIGVFVSMLFRRRKQQMIKKKQKEIAYRQAIAKAREQEQQERVFKAETGDVPMQLYLAKEAERNRPQEALFWYEKAALAGNEMAMHSMVRVCQRAPAEPVYQEKQQFWELSIAALQGDGDARYRLGLAFIQGKGVEKDHDRGITEIDEVAVRGHLRAQIYMGDWCKSAQNLQANNFAAAEWYYRAALQNSTEAMQKLGEMYEHGKGVSQDITRASYWYEAAAEKGDVEAQYRAGLVWTDVDNSPNKALAYVWLFIAAANGHQQATSLRDQVATNMGVDVIVGLQALAKPIYTKLAGSDVAEHSVIKAFNRLYKRPSYFPAVDGTEFDEFVSGTVHTSELTEEQAMNQTSQSFNNDSYAEGGYGSQSVQMGNTSSKSADSSLANSPQGEQ